jgi:hypothetical protein
MLRRSAGRTQRGLTWAATGVLLAVALAWVPPTPAWADEEDPYSDWARLPEVRIGDHWEYELGGRDRGYMVNEVVSRETKTNREFRLSVDTFKISSSGTIYSDQTTGGVLAFSQAPQLSLTETKHDIEATKWVRTDDHATVQMEGHVWIDDILDAEVVESFDPPFVQSFFPHTAGFRWVSQVDYFLQRGGDDPKTGKATLRAHVTDVETVSVPAGTFKALRIEHDIIYEDDRATSNVVRWWSQEACGLVKEERYNADGQLVNWMELTDWECSGAHVEEPDYTGRGVQLTRHVQPPWLDEPIETGIEDGQQGLVSSSLPSGPVVWIAVGVMAGLSVAFVLLGRRGR